MVGSEAQHSHIQELLSWASSGFEPRGRKLTFSEKCGIAYALKERGVKTQTVRDAFGLSNATVSWLRHCLQPGRLHYRDVWREYQDLGPEAFAEKHYTRDLHFRFRRVLDGIRDENQTDRAVKLAGANPKAAKYRGVHTLPDETQWEIDLREEGDPPGWAIRSLEKPEAWHGKERIKGLEGWKPFETSTEAYDAIFEINQFPNPRKED